MQKRGIYWDDYPVVGGTLRENMQQKPGQPLAAADHPAAKLRWNAVKTAALTNETDDNDKHTILKRHETPILEVCRRRLIDSVKPTDLALKIASKEMRQSTGAECAMYAAIEEPDVVFILRLWPSMDAYHASTVPHGGSSYLGAFSKEEWVEHVPINSMEDLPLKAPIMTISRCLFNESGDHVEKYLQQNELLLPTIEEHVKPWSYVGYFTVDSTDTYHKRMVFGGWRSKKHHQELASRLKKDCDFFEEIPLHYDPQTQHRHCWNVESETYPEMFEVLDGFVHQKPGERA